MLYKKGGTVSCFTFFCIGIFRYDYVIDHIWGEYHFFVSYVSIIRYLLFLKWKAEEMEEGDYKW